MKDKIIEIAKVIAFFAVSIFISIGARACNEESKDALRQQGYEQGYQAGIEKGYSIALDDLKMDSDALYDMVKKNDDVVMKLEHDFLNAIDNGEVECYAYVGE